MRFETNAAVGAALLFATTVESSHGHANAHLESLERRHLHHRVHNDTPGHQEIKKRGQCAFPTDAGLVAVTPGSQNAGWAMSPDQPCLPGHYCPYACPSGQVSMQWNPLAIAYTYPLSMDGGLYCDESGAISKPFPNKPYCVDGVGNVAVQNNAGAVHSVCQTVLPGNEAMLIPNSVTSTLTLAVPAFDYWCDTAAHYYHNNPGLTEDEACIWGDGSLPLGNWAPYVSGMNQDQHGNTFLKLGYNPIYTDSHFVNTKPSWGLKIECDGDGCNGLPCSIDPAVNAMNSVTSGQSASGAGGADFCVVTVPQGVKATIVVFNAGESDSTAPSSNSVQSVSSSSSTSTSTSTSTTPLPSTTSTTSATPTPTTSSTSSSSSSTLSTTSSTSSSSSSSVQSTTNSTTQSTHSSTVSSAPSSVSVQAGQFYQNETTTAAGTPSVTPVSVESTASVSTSAPAATSTAAASSNIVGSSFGLVVALSAVFGYLL